MKTPIVIALVAMVSIATVAMGLRVGAGQTMRAAIVVGAPLPQGGGRAAWQLRTQDDDLHTRTAATTAFTATVRAKGVERTISGATNVDGVAEIAFDAPGLASGDPIDFDVRGPDGALLARGAAAWPKEAPRATVVDHAVLRAARSEGSLRMRTALLGSALAPGQSGRLWIATSSPGEPPRNPRVEATPDLGLEVVSAYAASKDPACPREGVVEIVARGMNGGLALHAKDDLGREGDWYGAIPVAAGAMHVRAPLFADPGPVRVSITSASARTLAYVEVDDDQGRAFAAALPLAGDPPHADVTFDLRTPGRHFLVVSGEPDGATNVAGATRALPIWIGPNAPCESELAEVSAKAFPRFVALDGFVEKRAALAARHKKGRLIALLGLVIGSFLETLLLLRAARESRVRMRQLQNALAVEAESIEPVSARGPLDLFVVLGLSLLGFVLLFALVAAFATK